MEYPLFHYALQPVPDEDRSHWVGPTPAGVLYRFDLETGTAEKLAESRHEQILNGLELPPDGRFAAVYYRHGPYGWVLDDAATGAEVDWFPGPRGEFFCDDGLLVAAHHEVGTVVWDPAAGEALHFDPGPTSLRYHPGARCFLDPRGGSLCKLVGRDFPQAWRTVDVLRVARGIAAGRTFDDQPVLADALEDAGCTDAALLTHLRHPEPHGRECWAIDRILGG